MKKFFDYKDEIKKCSQCGLCMSVCPIYHETKNDCTNARGLCSMLNGILQGRLKPDKTILKYLETCTKCNKCKDFCPSSIDLPNIFKAAQEYLTKSKL